MKSDNLEGEVWEKCYRGAKHVEMSTSMNQTEGEQVTHGRDTWWEGGDTAGQGGVGRGRRKASTTLISAM